MAALLLLKQGLKHPPGKAASNLQQFFPPVTYSTVNSGFQLKLLTVAGVCDVILASSTWQ